MPSVYSSPGVYVEEIPTLPPSVAEVSTAVPAFIGYTEMGATLIPTRIQSLKEYEQEFGGPPEVVKSVTVTTNGSTPFELEVAKDIPLLYYSLRLYFDNGGGPCYVVSAGKSTAAVALADFKNALDALKKEDEPTLIVMPDAARLNEGDFSDACSKALTHCGTMKNRFAILDLKKDVALEKFRTGISSDYLAYGAVYTPYLVTTLSYAFSEDKVTVAGSSDAASGPVTFSGSVGGLTVTCAAASDKTPTVEIGTGSEFGFLTEATTPKLTVTLKKKSPMSSKDVAEAWGVWKKANPDAGFDIGTGDETPVAAATGTLVAPQKQVASSKLKNLKESKTPRTALYNQIKAYLATQRVTLPPSGAVAGIYARVDRDRGVWKAPANVAVASVLGLSQNFTSSDLDGMNVDPTSGKSINVIRSFTGRGTLVWGARTLAGNDNEWRYIPVRRLFIMIEVSAQKATAFAVFEPNAADTWLKVKAMIESFLYGLWERGALAGSKPEDAYFVHVGLGTTMTAQDILEGRMIIKIGVAAVRPAEFIILQFSHKMQEA